MSENVYKKFFEVYEKNKKGLELKGVTSFSGYLTSRMEEMMIKDEVFAKHSPLVEKIAVDQNRVILKDNKRNRIVEVLMKNGELQCLLDERSDCVHVGFVYSLPELYCIINNNNNNNNNNTNKAIKVPRSTYML
ncbi:MAG: hypothetical protein WBE61_14025 [Nitrososphaeraceae archaeon]